MLVMMPITAIAQSNFVIEDLALNKSCPVLITWKKPSFENNLYQITGIHADGSLKMTVDLSGSSPKGKVTGNYIKRSKLSYEANDNAIQLKMEIFANAGTRCHVLLTARKIDGLKDKSGNKTLDLEAAEENNGKSMKFSTKLDKAKSTCVEIGFTAGTEDYGKCVLKMIDD